MAHHDVVSVGAFNSTLLLGDHEKGTGQIGRMQFVSYLAAGEIDWAVVHRRSRANRQPSDPPFYSEQAKSLFRFLLISQRM